MRWCRVGPVVALWLALVPPALAQTRDDPQRALSLGHDALAAYNKGNWAEARTKFAEAEQLAHSPVFVLYLARCARNAGDLAGAKETYDRLAGEVIPAGAPAPWSAAVATAKQEREELEKKLAELAAAAAAASASASATSTGAGVAPPPSPPATATAATATGGVTTTRPPASTSAPTSRPTATTGPAASSAGRAGNGAGPSGAGQPGSLAPGLGVIGLGAAGIGIGIGMFVHAKSMADGLLERCLDQPVCAAEDRAVRDSAIGMADGATAAFGVGGGLLAAGAVLLILRPGGGAAPAKSRVSVQPGWASIRVTGSF